MVARRHRPHRCGQCGLPGHNARSCRAPLLIGTPLPPPELGCSLGDQAALYAAETGCSLHEAALKYGIRRQAVEYAWPRLYPGTKTPRIAAREERARQMVELARSGVRQAEIARRVGVDRETVRERLKAAGIPAPRLTVSAQVEQAVLMIQSGATTAEAAASSGVSYQAVAARLAQRGIKRRPGQARRRDGRIMRAVERVLAGERLTDACRAEQCAPSGVSTYLKRLRSNP